MTAGGRRQGSLRARPNAGVEAYITRIEVVIGGVLVAGAGSIGFACSLQLVLAVHA